MVGYDRPVPRLALGRSSGFSRRRSRHHRHACDRQCATHPASRMQGASCACGPRQHHDSSPRFRIALELDRPGAIVLARVPREVLAQAADVNAKRLHDIELRNSFGVRDAFIEPIMNLFAGELRRPSHPVQASARRELKSGTLVTVLEKLSPPSEVFHLYYTARAMMPWQTACLPGIHEGSESWLERALRNTKILTSLARCD
jgi:hypothetical protein